MKHINLEYKQLFSRTNLRTVVSIIVLTAIFVLFDLIVDQIGSYLPGLGIFHIVFAVSVVSIAYFIMRRAVLNRKQAEVLLLRSRDELEARVQERTVQLEKVNQALRSEITERELAEQARYASFEELAKSREQAETLAWELRLANNMLRTLIETLPAGMLMIDAVGEVLLANSFARSILNHNPLEDTYSLRVDPLLCFVDDSALPAEQIPLNRAIRKGETTTGYEVTLEAEDGQPNRIVLIAATPIHDENGKIISAVEILQDITNMKQMEEALREKEERYRILFDNFTEPATVWSKDGILLMENLISARNLGGIPDDFIGKFISEIFGDQGVDYLKRINHVIETGEIDIQEDAVDLKSGRHYFWTTMQRVPFQHDQYAAQIISYDITDRKLAEEALRASEEKFATVYHFSPDAIAIISGEDLTVVDVNEAFNRLMGYPRNMIIGKRWTELDLVTSSDQQAVITQIFQEKGKIADFEVSFQTINGDLATILLSLSPITIENKVSILAIGHDITERKRSEQALLKAQSELALGAHQRAAMEERQRLARELHDSVSQAIYGISLGANTALTLLDIDRSRVVEALNYVISLAQAGLTEMRALIFELRPESLQREGLVNALVRQTSAIGVRHEMTIETDFCPEPDVSIDTKETLYRIAQEAMQNAIKHARSPCLKIDLIQENGFIILNVRDQGVGFDTMVEYPGHLGLHSMQERAVNAGGTLEITSIPGEGTQVHARLPIPSLPLLESQLDSSEIVI